MNYPVSSTAPATQVCQTYTSPKDLFADIWYDTICAPFDLEVTDSQTGLPIPGIYA